MIGQKVSVAFSVDLTIKALSYVSLFFVARWMGAEVMGTISYGFSYVGIFSFLAVMGMGVAHIKRISEGGDTGKLIGTYLTIRTILVAIMSFAILLSLLVYTKILGKRFDSPYQLYVIYFSLAAMIINCFANTATSTFAGRIETAKQKIPELAGKMVEVPLKVSVALAGLGVVLLAGTAVASAVVTLLVSWFFLKGLPISRPDWTVAKSYIKFALPVTILTFTTSVIQNLDKLMIGFFWNNEVLGYYSGAQQISMLFSMLSVAVGMVAFPQISALNSQADVEGVRRFVHTLERNLSIVLLPAGALIYFLSVPLMGILLGSEFKIAGPILFMLTGGLILQTLSEPYVALILGLDRAYMSAVLSIIFMLLNVVLNLIFIPTRLFGVPLLGMGAYGGAFASAIAMLMMLFIYRGIAWKMVGTKLINPSIIKHIAAMGAMVVIIDLFPQRFGVFSPFIGIGLALTTYYGILSALHEFSYADINLFLKFISPKETLKYIIGEIKGGSRLPTE